MADRRFFTRKGPFTIQELVDILGCEVSRPGYGDRVITAVGSMVDADEATITFLANRSYTEKLGNCSAGAVILLESDLKFLPETAIGLISRRPHYDFARVAQLFYPEYRPARGIHPTAHIDESATLGTGLCIDPHAVIHADVVLGDDVWIGANATIDRGVSIGRGTFIGAGSYVGYADIGEMCRIHSCVTIGSRGFGFAMSPEGHLDVPQVGIVRIGNAVEVGANTAIDRGMGPDTVIGDGCKIDNLVQIGHNVVMGRGCVMAGQSGIAGSTKLGNFVACGAQSGIAGHLTIGDGAQIGAKAGVLRNVAAGEKVGGYPAVPIRQWLRQHVFVESLMKKRDKK